MSHDGTLPHGGKHMSTEFDVLIVGGGAAGIGAARHLGAAGRSALVIEASSRLGGRAWTLELAGVPLDLGCGWLHSADRNSWVSIAESSGLKIDRRRPAWGEQYRNLGFSPKEQAAARQAFADWIQRLTGHPPATDRSADALNPECEWNAYLQAMSGFISGDVLERMSIADYLAYNAAATGINWRVPTGYGSLIAASLPETVALRLAAPAELIDLNGRNVKVGTPLGSVRARTAIITVSTAVLSGDTIKLPPALDPWRHAASQLPLGRDEKLFLEIAGENPFAPETQVIGDPHDVGTGVYSIRPFGRPLIECFFGGEGARLIEDSGPAAGFAFAVNQLVALFGSEVRQALRPLVASAWARTSRIGGAYSYALPGQAAARDALAQPYAQRLFFAGEATHRSDFSTAHGAHDSGVRAAEEAIAALKSLHV